MVPHMRLAPAAARRPLSACGGTPAEPSMVLKPSMIAAATMQTLPHTTLAIFFACAPCSSRNSSLPHSRPTSALVFHKGNAVASPTSRIANTVSVFATAHSAPARIAQTTRCFLQKRSAKTYVVPLSRVGNVQRAVKTPATMHSETANGERPALTNLVGASAAPSQTPAARPQITPRPCSDRPAFVAGTFTAAVLSDVI